MGELFMVNVERGEGITYPFTVICETCNIEVFRSGEDVQASMLGAKMNMINHVKKIEGDHSFVVIPQE